FEPFIIRRLKELGYVHTVRSAKKMIERQTPEVWNILEEVTKNHTVLLNRAPTLHRLSIQAFEPILIEGEAIRIHPLVCTAYNADFDGDQMAVHVPLSVEAQLEARTIMLAPNNILGPSNGRPITTPSQDIPLGCYYLTANPRGEEAKKQPPYPLFANVSEVELALSEGVITKHSRIRFLNPDYGRKTIFGNPNSKIIETTAGRVIFNEIWPPELGFFNKTAGKKQLSEIIWQCFKNCGQEATVKALDRLKELGFREATRAGISIGVTDMIIPSEKYEKIQEAYAKLKPYEEHLARGIITKSERNNKFQEIWTHTVEEVVNYVFRAIEHNDRKEEHNPIFVMVDSGARGNRTQVKQLAGLRGLMANHKNEIIQHPILSNFREGLSVLEYYISTHGARKGLVDTALKTADAGYLTRKLVDACQDAIITEEDCKTANGIVVRPIYQADEEVVSLSARIIGRTYSGDKPIKDPDTGQIILEPNQLIDEDIAAKIQQLG
ncbi:MAG: DNA-directed RNA polymerase subunit beta', partial [Chthoniobacterales bacterium]|nr:DNA-directed RNA polymerase subunit beta' [Chthoniobacterales bacterium]